MGPTKLLLGTIPHWARVAEMQPGTVSVITEAEHPSGQPLRTYKLAITEIGSRLDVRESKEDKILPCLCLQRHFNLDGSFCIGLGAPSSVKDHESAAKWWQRLLGYLQCQDIAHLTRRWPPNRGLSHGTAADYQIEAEKIASKIGLLVSYREFVEYGEKWPPEDIEMTDNFVQLLELESKRSQAEISFLDWVNFDCCDSMDNCPIATRASLNS